MPRPPAECGTDSGYYRHLRTTNTPACDPCLAAHADATARTKATTLPKKIPCISCGSPTSKGRCVSCAAKERERNRPTPADDIAFHGQWRNVRGIWRAA